MIAEIQYPKYSINARKTIDLSSLSIVKHKKQLNEISEFISVNNICRENKKIKLLSNEDYFECYKKHHKKNNISYEACPSCERLFNTTLSKAEIVKLLELQSLVKNSTKG